VIALGVLILGTLVARGAGAMGLDALDSWPSATRVGLAVMLLFTASAHFNAMKADLLKMVPPWIRNPEIVVTLTGVCEILGAIGLLVPATRRVAAIALIVFFVAVFPANVRADREHVTLRGRAATPLRLRAPMQLLFIALTWWSGVLGGSR
jgi:uncharacterized membrane protein